MKMTKEVKIGLTGVIALVVLFLGINFLKGMNLFSSEDVYYIQFKNAKGLSKNSTVYADGFNIGRVSNVLYDFRHPGKVVVEISVDDALRIPKGSAANLDEGMLGGCTLNMQLNPMSEACYQPGDTIMGSDVGGLMESASQLLPKAEPVLARLDSLLEALNTLARDSNLHQILCNTQTLTANLNESSRQLNRLLKTDMPKLAQTYTQAGEHIITLTDHLNFALTRHRQGIQIQNALLWEIQKFYQEEFRVGLQALSIIEKELGVRLPEDEAGFFALHIVNAEMDADMMQTIHVPEIIKDIMNIVCYTFQREPDSGSYVYERFVTHLKHFLQRAVKGEQYGTDDCEELNGMIRESFPKSYRCALRIKSYIKARMKYEVSLEEVTYLAIHLQKMEEK